jgi:hypothetical protein
MLEVGAHAKMLERERLAQQRRWEEQRLMQKQVDDAKKQLEAITERYQQLKLLREVVAEIEAAGVDLTGQVGQWPSWRAWVTDYLDTLDPIKALQTGNISLHESSYSFFARNRSGYW